MNSAQISAFFEKNKVAVLGAAGVGVVGLALTQRNKGDKATGPAAGTVGGTLPAAAVVPAQTGPGYTSGAYDVYNGLQPTLEAILQQQNRQTDASSGITKAPAAIASTLFAPTGTGTYINMPNGVGGEVQADGSIFGTTYEQWQQIVARDPAAASKITKLSSNVDYYSTDRNLQAAAKKSAGAGGV